MTKHVRFLIALSALCALWCAPAAEAKIDYHKLKDITLEEAAQDIVFSRDGSTAYILGKKAILFYSVQEATITDTIALTKPYSSIALSPDESTFYLTAQDSTDIAVIQYTVIHDIAIGKSPVIGNPQAPVTVTAFIDYQCPYCARVYPLLKELLEKYPNDVKLVLKHYPLPMHKFAKNSALAALAAAQQNKYEKVTGLFFANFQSLNDDTIRKYVQQAGLDMEKFDQDMAKPLGSEILQQDMSAVRQARVKAVPTIFINGIVPKSRSVEAFSKIINQELQKKK